MGRKTNRKLVKGYKQPVHNRGNPKGECMERCSNSSIIRATQTRTTRYHFTPVRLTKILGSQAILYVGRAMRKCKYLYTSERFLIHVALLENSWEYLVKFITQQSHFWAYILEKSECKKRI
jgi:hypothetical protein